MADLFKFIISAAVFVVMTPIAIGMAVLGAVFSLFLPKE